MYNQINGLSEVQYSRKTLNVGGWLHSSSTNGPGERFVLWLQGCLLSCCGCINPEFQSLDDNQVFAVEMMADKILSTKDIEGVTFTGGEPILQAKALSNLSEILKANGLSIVCYSGFTHEQLLAKNDSNLNHLLSLTDVLIDGPFIKEKAALLRWRGSSNQRVLFLSDRYHEWEAIVNEPLQQTEIIAGNLDWAMTGIWPDLLRIKLQQYLQGCGEKNESI